MVAGRGVAGRQGTPPRPAPEPTPGIDVQKVLELAGLVVAPVTLATAVLYWVGLELTEGRFGWFGLTSGVLGFSTTDYLVRGAEGGVVPLVALFVGVMAGAAVHAGLVRLATRNAEQWYRRALRAALAGALVLTAAALWWVLVPFPWPAAYLLPPTLLATAPLLALRLAWELAADPARGVLRVAAAAAVGLALVGVFWGVSLYADALGRGRGQQIAADLSVLPAVTLYSQGPLALDAAEERLGTGDGVRFTHRYSELRLLLYSGGRYFLLPDTWTRASGGLVVLPDAPEVRVELTPGRSG